MGEVEYPSSLTYPAEELCIRSIVKMSQQKYASNVVEKCLTYGTPEERQLLINEILGSTDENEPLQVHLNALKRYTYGKHIVTRVEKLVAAGGKPVFSRLSSATKCYYTFVLNHATSFRLAERRIGVPSHSS
ncbi:hypothetical protein BHE74_00044822 [Ensete ventricosum]|nr:hypothetical protein BHE74_00044822 [Ensete ventricosum]